MRSDSLRLQPSYSSLRGERSLVWLAGSAAIFANYALEPITVHSMPMFFLMLGAAVPAVSADSAQRSSRAQLIQFSAPGRWCGDTAYRWFADRRLSAREHVHRRCWAANQPIRLVRFASTYGYHDSYVDEQLSIGYANAIVAHPGQTTMLLERSRRLSQRLVDEYPTVNSIRTTRSVVIPLRRCGGIQARGVASSIFPTLASASSSPAAVPS